MEIKNSRNEFSKEQCLQIEELCLEEELVRILEAGQSCDVNLIIALVLSRQLGWPIDFINETNSITFILIVPASPFAASEMLPASSTTTGLLAKADVAVSPSPTPTPQQPSLKKPSTISYDQMHKDIAVVNQRQ